MDIFRTIVAAVLVLALPAMQPAGAASSTQACHPLGYHRSALLELRAEGFLFEDPATRRRFAIELLDCLGDADPVLRDQVAYEAYVALLRGGQLDGETIRTLRSLLLERLSPGSEDENGFGKPFAALVLSEVARADRLDPLFTDQERAALVTAATAYMRSIRDYRGFDETSGWRHAVAHAADLLMQLSLNPSLDRSQLMAILEAVAAQVVPGTAHFYVYGESGRLARPVLFIAMREVFDEQYWSGWLGEIASPGPFGDWQSVFSTQAGLARLHNTKAFLQVIYINASASENQALAPLQTAALESLKQLP